MRDARGQCGTASADVGLALVQALLDGRRGLRVRRTVRERKAAQEHTVVCVCAGDTHPPLGPGHASSWCLYGANEKILLWFTGCVQQDDYCTSVLPTIIKNDILDKFCQKHTQRLNWGVTPPSGSDVGAFE